MRASPANCVVLSGIHFREMWCGNMLIRTFLVLGLAVCSGCGPVVNLTTPTESPFLVGLDLKKMMDEAAPPGLTVSQSGHLASGSASPGKGNWRRLNTYTFQGTADVGQQIMKRLHDGLILKAKQSGTEIDVVTELGRESSRTNAFRFQYTSGPSRGTVDAKLEPTPGNLDASETQPASYSLTIEITEQVEQN